MMGMFELVSYLFLFFSVSAEAKAINLVKLACDVKITEVKDTGNLVPASITPENFSQLFLALQFCGAQKAQVAGYMDHKGNYILYSNGTVTPADPLDLPSLALFFEKCPCEPMKVVCVVNPDDPDKKRCFVPSFSSVSKTTCCGDLPDQPVICGGKYSPIFAGSLQPLAASGGCCQANENPVNPNTGVGCCANTGGVNPCMSNPSGVDPCMSNTGNQSCCQNLETKDNECCCSDIPCGEVSPTLCCKELRENKCSSDECSIPSAVSRRRYLDKTPCGVSVTDVDASKVFEFKCVCKNNVMIPIVKVSTSKVIEKDEYINLRQKGIRLFPTILNRASVVWKLRDTIACMLDVPFDLYVTAENHFYVVTKDKYYGVLRIDGDICLDEMAIEDFCKVVNAGMVKVLFPAQASE
ncbi:hypothetical protein ENBRE01_1276 [Enteropsectra breve]|nr:hypothetical protein ENBRE01_1276 [Enteropsectra breve]